MARTEDLQEQLRLAIDAEVRIQNLMKDQARAGGVNSISTELEEAQTRAIEDQEHILTRMGIQNQPEA